MSLSIKMGDYLIDELSAVYGRLKFVINEMVWNLKNSLEELFTGPQAKSFVEWATAACLETPDYQAMLEVCNMVNTRKIQGVQVVRALGYRLTLDNPKVQYFALIHLQTYANKCENAFLEIAEEKILDVMEELIDFPWTKEFVWRKAVDLIKEWSELSEAQCFPIYREKLEKLKRSRVSFPAHENRCSVTEAKRDSCDAEQTKEKFKVTSGSADICAQASCSSLPKYASQTTTKTIKEDDGSQMMQRGTQTIDENEGKCDNDQMINRGVQTEKYNDPIDENKGKCNNDQMKNRGVQTENYNDPVDENEGKCDNDQMINRGQTENYNDPFGEDKHTIYKCIQTEHTNNVLQSSHSIYEELIRPSEPAELPVALKPQAPLTEKEFTAAPFTQFELENTQSESANDELENTQSESRELTGTPESISEELIRPSEPSELPVALKPQAPLTEKKFTAAPFTQFELKNTQSESANDELENTQSESRELTCTPESISEELVRPSEPAELPVALEPEVLLTEEELTAARFTQFKPENPQSESANAELEDTQSESRELTTAPKPIAIPNVAEPEFPLNDDEFTEDSVTQSKTAQPNVTPDTNKPEDKDTVDEAKEFKMALEIEPVLPTKSAVIPDDNIEAEFEIIKEEEVSKGAATSSDFSDSEAYDMLSDLDDM